jgi:membrane-bound lytic murein transglycosylase F
MLLLQGCEQPPLLERLQSRGTLHIATVAGPLSCYLGETGAAGMEYELASRFSRELGLTAQFTVYPTRHAAGQAVKNGMEDMASNIYPATVEESSSYLSSSWMQTHPVFAHHMGNKAFNPEKMNNTELVLPDHSKLSLLLNEYKLKTTEIGNSSEEEILALVNAGNYSHTLSTTAQLKAHANSLPYLVSGRTLQQPVDMRWLFPRIYDSSLRDRANHFLKQQLDSGALKELQDRYIHKLPKRDFVTRKSFWKHVESRLTKYIPLFKKAAEDTGIDWRLLAAIGYQESHSNRKETSPTGVRCIMMLTRDTARQQKIDNRLDPEQSIMGGARHLLWMEKRIPSHIQGEDLLWFTLASYNIGYGHLEDARILTERQGGNPNSWKAVKQRLPLLRKKKYYSTLKHGRARGNEPVTYVENIRYYYSLLVFWDTRKHQRDCSTAPDNSNNALSLRIAVH